MRAVIGVGVSALLTALIFTTSAQAQVGLREGDVVRNPVRATERELLRECGTDRLEPGSTITGDFTGDRRDDIIIRIEQPCQGSHSYFCGTRGCRTDVWARIDDGGRRSYRLVKQFAVSEVEIIPWYDGPALSLDRRVVWVWNGSDLERASRTGAGGAAASDRPSWRQDRPSWGQDRPSNRRDDWDAPRDPGRRGDWDDRANTPTPPAAVEPGRWRVDYGRRGRAMAVVEETRGEGRLEIACAPRSDALRMTLLASSMSKASLSREVGAQHLVAFEVDGRVIETRLMLREGPEGVLVEPGVIVDGALSKALKRGSRVLLRNLSDNSPLGVFGLSNSRATLTEIESGCAN